MRVRPLQKLSRGMVSRRTREERVRIVPVKLVPRSSGESVMRSVQRGHRRGAGGALVHQGPHNQSNNKSKRKSFNKSDNATIGLPNKPLVLGSCR